MARLARLCRDPGGNTAVEFAFIVPVLLFLGLGIIELGRVLWTQNALHYAVEEAARCVTIDTSTCGTSDQTKTYAADRAGLQFANSVFTVTSASCGNQVSASLSYRFMPYLSLGSITLTAQSCFPT